jgi:hypothetical protein
MRCRLLLLLVVWPLLVPPLEAGIFFGRKKEPVEPKKRVQELILILKNDRDADNRMRAAEELRHYDLMQFPEVLPALIQAAQGDPRPAVRLEAVQSLGKLRPISQSAGETLEAILANDPSMRVRLQARTTLMQYQWAGYRSTGKPPSPVTGIAPAEPPLATTSGLQSSSASPALPPVTQPSLPPRQMTQSTTPPLPPQPAPQPAPSGWFSGRLFRWMSPSSSSQPAPQSYPSTLPGGATTSEPPLAPPMNDTPTPPLATPALPSSPSAPTGPLNGPELP